MGNPVNVPSTEHLLQKYYVIPNAQLYKSLSNLTLNSTGISITLKKFQTL